MTEKMLEKLENAFSYGFSDEQACLQVGIDPKTLYNYQNKNPEFLQRKRVLKSRPEMQAKKVVVDNMRLGDVNTSKWYLEHKCNKEFGTSTRHGNIDDEDLRVTIINDVPRKK